MDILKGIAVSPGVAICSAVVIEAEDYRIPERFITRQQVQPEIQRLRQAFLDAIEEVTHLHGTQADIWDRRIKDIFAVHLHFLRDRSLRKEINEKIRENHFTAEYAVSTILREVASHFSDAQDAYISERVNDIYDIENRLLRHLIGLQREDLNNLSEPVVVISHDLTPSQTAGFDRKLVKGLATDAGGRTSHTAIVARSLGIPAVVALGNVTASIAAGDTVIVDGNRGTVIINPDNESLEEYRLLAEEFIEHEHQLIELAHLDSVTTDGHPVQLLGNIEFPYEADITLQKGGTGIGLYRTEFLYLDVDQAPTEEDHYEAYTSSVSALGDRPVTIRTLDLGADKFTQKRYLRERNPFLGLRSIRYCLQNLPMFKAQIRAMLRASVHGNIKIMFPLITSLMELRQAKWIVADAREDLEEQGIAFKDHIPIGAMIETPAAALIAESLADEVDFFSIGTNDLIQYTLAVDRVNENVASLYTPAHPAVLNLIQHVIKVANRANIDVSLCGEMASDTEYTPLLVGLGLKSLSLAPPMIPEVKKVIRSVSLDHCESIARRALQFDTSKQTINYLREERRIILDEEI
jgi:phosphotransferase system enzyme I (PtsI)